jgi:hypothetical protein
LDQNTTFKKGWTKIQPLKRLDQNTTFKKVGPKYSVNSVQNHIRLVSGFGPTFSQKVVLKLIHIYPSVFKIHIIILKYKHLNVTSEQIQQTLK